ncbi:hypothetical protein BO224_06955 [Erysipelotrichaceae bacterium NYU-BL-E8]|uniref:Uncharacterized protein n=1 Tax=Ileibacterium valens TaxID=1862668 RepID=A0A1U7NHZ4_9FIRM|nr:hypothetical protein BO224_06955 [Erysipelotrichaceae bacterium NYU-BL-E8]OLU41594.1 hypothetical protein BM735_03880 [Erysipelotrichaceae bacterium NYU-BL-F16]OLU41758.1 hypothetical protein BO222_02675 [Ileibacterium valens]
MRKRKIETDSKRVLKKDHIIRIDTTNGFLLQDALMSLLIVSIGILLLMAMSEALLKSSRVKANEEIDTSYFEQYSYYSYQ